MKVTSTTYGEISEGDVIVVEGHPMKVRNLRRPNLTDGRQVIRFEGDLVDTKDSLYHTGFNGGTYGGIPSVGCGKVVA